MAVTVTGTAIVAALKKRLESQGHPTEPAGAHNRETLMLDVMAVITTNSATAIADAAAEVVQNPVRPFIFGV